MNRTGSLVGVGTQNAPPRVQSTREHPILPFDPPAAAPRVWLLIGDKLGDNRQVEQIASRLAERLNWRSEVRRLQFQGIYQSGKPQFRADRSHVDWSASDPVEPPWPDLVITVGRRPSMVALWIKAQSRGHTHVVIVGRPRRWLRRFDLIVAAAHHHVPFLPNVLHIGLPLIRPDLPEIAAARERWQGHFAKLPRPLVALLVGGPTKPHMFDAAAAHDLVTRASQCVGAGTLWIVTSPRTSAEVIDALDEGRPASARLFRFRPDDPDNPYLGLLACADRFIVTGDSVSMQVEVARLGKPLAIYALPVACGWVERLRRSAAHIAYGRSASALPARLIRGLHRIGVMQFPRDVAEIHALLIEQGFAVTLGQPFKAAGAGVNLDLDQIVDRIRALRENEVS